MQPDVPRLVRTLSLGLLLTAPVAALAAEAGTDRLSLSQAVDTALRSNPMIQTGAAGRQMAAASAREAGAGWFPSLQAGVTYTRSNNPVFVFGSLLEQDRFSQSDFALDKLNDPAPYNNFRGSLSLRVPLFDQLRTPSRVAQARTGVAQADDRTRSIEQRVRFEVVRAYYGAQVADAQKKVAEEAVKTAEADVKRVRDLSDAGLVVKSDLLAAQVQLTEFRHERIQAGGNAAVAYAGLNTALGLSVVTRHSLPGELKDRAFDVSETEALVTAALENRPDYAAAVAAVRSAKEGVRGALGQYLPRVDGFANYGSSAKNLGVDSTDYAFGLALTVDLFDLGRSARVDQARAGVLAADAELRQAASRIGIEVVQARERFLTARDRLAVAAGAEEQAAEALRIVEERYQAGLTTITEVLRAQTALLKARTNRLGARYEVYVGYSSVLLASGTLNDVGAFDP